MKQAQLAPYQPLPARRLAPARGAAWLTSRQLSAVLFIGPAVLFLCAVLLYPIAYAAWLSLHRFNLARLYLGQPFVGLSNYGQALGDEHFLRALTISVGLTAACLCLEVPLGMALALAVNQPLRGRAVFRAIFLTPVLLTPVVVALVWRFMFQWTGVWNYLLGLVGLGPIDWSTTEHGLLQIVIVVVWQNTPFSFLVLLAGLQALPRDVYEAALTDGASRIQTFLRITLPLMRPFFLVVLTIRTMDLLRLFDEGYILTGGGPGRTTETLSQLVYTNTFTFFDIGYGSALSVLQLGIVLVFMLIYFRFLRPRSG